MGEQHSITLESLNPGDDSAVTSVVIIVTSTPTEYTLYLNIPLDIDINGDGIADIRVTLLGLTGSYAEINLVSLTPAGSAHLLGMLGVGG